jgi:hypothetical protein
MKKVIIASFLMFSFGAFAQKHKGKCGIDIEKTYTQNKEFKAVILPFKASFYDQLILTNKLPLFQKTVTLIRKLSVFNPILLNPYNEFYKEAARIIKNENIEIDEESKQYLLLITNGSIRNLINYLEKMYILGEPITIELCKNICSNISFHEFEKYVEHLKQNELTDAIQLLYNIHDYGYSVIDILDYFFSFTKLTNVIDEETKYRIIPFLCKYITIFHNVHEDCIELALFTNNLANIIHQ